MTYVPSIVHPSLHWNKRDPMLEPIADETSWAIITKTTTKSTTIPEKDSNAAVVHPITPPKGKKGRKSLQKKNINQK